MPIKKAPAPIVTKTGHTITESWCRKCAKMLPVAEFYEAVDNGFIDTNGVMSVCKDCIQKMYDDLFTQTQSVEKAIHKLCTSLNIKFSNEALSATKEHITTMLENGKKVNAVFSIYKMKLTATKKSMDKSGMEDMTYEDIGTIYVTEKLNPKELVIPEDVKEFWGRSLSKDDIYYLEKEYRNFKESHGAEDYAKVSLLRELCFTLLQMKKMRESPEDTDPRDFNQVNTRYLSQMDKLGLTARTTKESEPNKADLAIGMWIKDVEQYEPCEWLKNDPRGDMYRDVGNVEEYFQNYFVRPLKNLMLESRDFNVGENKDNSFDTDDDVDIPIKDGED